MKCFLQHGTFCNFVEKFFLYRYLNFILMALEERSGGAKYLGVSMTGTFYEKSKEEKEGFEKYVSEKNGAVSYRRNYTAITGYITGIYEKEIEHESVKFKMFNIEIMDSGEKYVVSTPLTTSTGSLDGIVTSFIKTYKNVDKTKKLRFTCNKKKNERGYVPKCLFISDALSDGAYKFYYTKENPNGMPEPEKKVKMGKESWDFTEQTNFLYERLKEFMEDFNNNYKQENMAKGGGGEEIQEEKEKTSNPLIEATNVKQVEPPTQNEHDDDLPF